MGQQWGKDLKDGTVPQERLVALIQVQMLNIPQHSRKAFRQGFLAGYGAGGEPVKSSCRQRKATHLDRSPTLQPMDRNKAHPSDRGHAARQREILLIGSIDQSFF